jgi:hypothetical protein
MIHRNDIGGEDVNWTGLAQDSAVSAINRNSSEFLQQLNFCRLYIEVHIPENYQTLSEELLHICCQSFRHADVLVL